MSAGALQVPVEPTVKTLEVEQKQWESVCAPVLNERLPWMARLDGHCFNQFTKMFKKPFDERISIAMVATTGDLMEEFSAKTGYTCSDELTLFWPEFSQVDLDRGARVPFGGKVQKLASLLAGFASVRFFFHLTHNPNIQYDVDGCPADAELVKNLTAQTPAAPYFDARVYNVRTPLDAAKNIVWRNRCLFRNTVSGYGRATFSQKQLHGLNSAEILAKLRGEGKDTAYEDTPAWYRLGVLVKKELVVRDAVNPLTQENVCCLRTRISQRVEDVPWRWQDLQLMAELISRPFHQTNEEVQGLRAQVPPKISRKRKRK